MQCPNCKMNISDSSRICLHCGLQFNQIQSSSGVCPNCKAAVNPTDQFCISCGTNLASTGASVSTSQVSQQTPQQQVGVPFVKQNNAINKEPYLKAYFGKRYDRVFNSTFSVGTLLFHELWLFVWRLYAPGIRLILTQIGVTIVFAFARLILSSLGIISVVLALTGTDLILTIIQLVVHIIVLINYAKTFPKLILNRAASEINKIMEKTADETERIKRCKRAGTPNYIFMFIVIFITCVLTFVVIKSVDKTTSESKSKYFSDVALEYVNEIRYVVSGNELWCGDKIENLPSGVYYYAFTTADGSSATDLASFPKNSAWDGGNLSGQIYIYKDTGRRYYQYSYALVLVDETGRGIGEFDKDGKPIKAISVNDLDSTVVSTRKDAYRKLYYEKAKSGTETALNVDTAPTAETVFDDKTIGELLKSVGFDSTSAPISCKIIK